MQYTPVISYDLKSQIYIAVDICSERHLSNWFAVGLAEFQKNCYLIVQMQEE